MTMNLLLQLLKIHTPKIVKVRKLKKLFQITAESFSCKINLPKRPDYEQLLHQYAVFAYEKCDTAIRNSENIDNIKRNLYVKAFAEGVKLRKVLHIKTMKDIILAGELFYSVIKINFSSKINGEVCINSCYFANYFSTDVCKIMSSLDEGIIAGISGGYVINFYQKITENQNCCLAEIKF
jgi:hypothetical protein